MMRRIRMLPALIGAIVYLLFDAQQAWAWGPGMHVSVGMDVLAHAAWLPAAVATVITQFAQDYLYGTIAADMVFAKRLSRVRQFCHHWSTGFSAVEHAADDRQKAFAYGYLSHLAADTVAHGKFVPRQVAVSGVPVNIGHLMWEIRADVFADPDAWHKVEGILALRHDDNHLLLERLLTQTLLPYDANRHLFAGINKVVTMKSWRGAIANVNRRSQYDLSSALMKAYRDECVDRTICLLTSLNKSPLLFEDPNGTEALAYIAAHRKDRRRLDRKGLSADRRVSETALSYEPRPWSTRFAGAQIIDPDNGQQEQAARGGHIVVPGS